MLQVLVATLSYVCCPVDSTIVVVVVVPDIYIVLIIVLLLLLYVQNCVLIEPLEVVCVNEVAHTLSYNSGPHLLTRKKNFTLV